MSVSPPKNPRAVAFSRKLRAALDDRRVSVRGLAKQLNPQAPESARSNLSRWLRAEVLPSRSSRLLLAEALGVDRKEFLADDDDEEADPAMRETFRLFVDLMGRIRSTEKAEAW